MVSGGGGLEFYRKDYMDLIVISLLCLTSYLLGVLVQKVIWSRTSKVDLNSLAIWITKLEGLKVPLTIAQVKEVMKIVFTVLSHMDRREVNYILKKYNEKNNI